MKTRHYEIRKPPYGIVLDRMYMNRSELGIYPEGKRLNLLADFDQAKKEYSEWKPNDPPPKIFLVTEEEVTWGL